MPPSNDVVRRSSSATEKRGVMYLPGVNVARVVEEVRSGVGAAAEAWQGHVDGRSQPLPRVTSCEVEIEGRVMWSDSNSITHSRTPPSTRRALFTSHSSNLLWTEQNRNVCACHGIEWSYYLRRRREGGEVAGESDFASAVFASFVAVHKHLCSPSTHPHTLRNQLSNLFDAM